LIDAWRMVVSGRAFYQRLPGSATAAAPRLLFAPIGPGLQRGRKRAHGLAPAAVIGSDRSPGIGFLGFSSSNGNRTANPRLSRIFGYMAIA